MNHYRLKRRFIPFLLAGLALLAAGVLRGQEAPRRPKICLALGGGGARGASHIGVLKVLEEAHVPIDCIAGTSMGSIVGGLYAIGYTPEDLKKLVSTTDWLGLFTDDPPRKELSFRRKEDDFIYAVGLEFGLSKGLTFPGGLVAGRKLSFLLQSLTLPAAGIDDFDKLEIPFRAVAADIVNGEAVVIGHGNVAKALRASMAIPVVFSPVELEGRLLVDGGNAQNLPVETARAMGADVVIAVDVGASGVLPKEKPKTAGAILSRMTDIPLLQNTVASRKLADLVLQPDLTGYGTGDFTKTGEIIPKGEIVARANLDKIKQYSVSEAEYSAWRRAHRGPMPPPPAIRQVTVAPVKDLDPRRITHMVHVTPGQTLDLKTLDQDLGRLYGTGLFENVEFDLQGQGPERDLRILPTPKPWGPTYMKVGLNLDSDFKGESSFGIRALVDATEMNRLGAIWKTAVEVGTNVDVGSQFFQPLGYASNFFAAPRVTFLQRPVDIFDGKGNRVATYRAREPKGGIDLGYDFGPFAELRGGVEWGKLKAELRTGPPIFPDVDVSIAAVVARLRVDQLDNVLIPHEGYFANIDFRAERQSLGSDFDYEKFDSGVVAAFTTGRLTTIGRVKWGDPLGSDVPFTDQFTLGGFLNLSGYAPGELRGPSAGLAEAVFFYRLARGTLIKGMYLGASAEAGNAWQAGQGRTFGDLKGAGSIFLAAETALGPFYLGYGYGGSGHSSLYLILSRLFQ
jgi:NTE family protein